MSRSNSGRGLGITTLLTSSPLAPMIRAPASTAVRTAETLPVRDHERLAAERHGQADLDQPDVGGLGRRVGAFDQRGDREGLDDAQRLQPLHRRPCR